MTRSSLGEFEHLVLLSILRLGDGAYGAAIIRDIEQTASRSVNQAAAYLALQRLQKKGWVESRLGPPTPERGGRAKRFFALLPEGQSRLRVVRSELLAMWGEVAAELDR